MTGRTVDAVLFDLGNVLIEWDPYLPYVGRYERAAVEEFFAAIDFFAFNHEQDAGRSWAEARAVLAAESLEHARMLDVYIDGFALAVTGEVRGAFQLVADVRAAGLGAYGLTNWPAETFHVAEQKAPVVHLLQGVVVSGREGIAKPDPRVFDLAAERFGLDPARTVFTDDREENVEAAMARGYLGAVFTGPGRLRRRLSDLGVELPARPAT